MNKKFVILKGGHSLYKIAIESILYIKVEKHHCYVQTSEIVYVVNYSLRQLLKILPPNVFIQVSSSVAVNTDHVNGISSTEILVANHRISLGRSFPKNKLRQRFFHNA